MIIIYDLSPTAGTVSKFLNLFGFKISSRVWILSNKKLLFKFKKDFSKMGAKSKTMAIIKAENNQIKVTFLTHKKEKIVSINEFISIKSMS